MQKIAVFIIVLIVLGNLQSCMLGPNFQKPQYSGPDRFRFDTTQTKQVVNLRWWELMNDPVLDTLIKTAINENLDVLMAAARIESARENISYVKADQYPSFYYSGGISGSGAKGEVKSGFSLYPEFSWEIGFWGKYRRMNEAARADFLAAEESKRLIQINLVSAVASTYFYILASKEQLRIAKRTLASRDSGLVIMQDKYDGGMISEMDLNQAKIQRDVAAVSIPVYKRVIALNENVLSILIGKMPQGIKTGKSFLEHQYELNIPVGIPSELLQRRPDVLVAQETYRAANAQIGVAEAMRWPSLNLTGLMGVASNDLITANAYGLAWSAAGTFFAPIFEFGKNKRRVEMAQEGAKIAMINYEKTVRQAFKEVEDALINISTFREELIAQESKEKTAVSSESLSYVRYNEGITTYLEVLEQQRSSFSAQLDVINTRLSLLNSYITLYKALGDGWLSPEEEKNFMQGNPGTVTP